MSSPAQPHFNWPEREMRFEMLAGRRLTVRHGARRAMPF
jgi:hypothetical protein